MGKCKEKISIENIIYKVALAGIVILCAYHMFSYFLRLVYINGTAADELARVLDIARNGHISLDSIFFGPSALIVKVCSIFLEEVEWYKAFIFSEILWNILLIWTFNRMIVVLFKDKLRHFTLFLISVAFYFGVPAYCFLYGGYMKSSIWTIACCILIEQIWKKSEKNEAFQRKLPAAWGKSMVVVGNILMAWLLCMGFVTDFVYFIPLAEVVMLEAFWTQKTDKRVPVLYLLATFSALVVMYAIKWNILSSTAKVTMMSIYWIVCWLLALQAVEVIRERHYSLELGLYGAFLLVLLGLQLAGVDGNLKENHPQLMENVEDRGWYFQLYGNNSKFLKTDYTTNPAIFFGTAEFLDLADWVIDKPKENVLAITDEITEEERIWFAAITDKDATGVDGLKLTDGALEKLLQEYDREYVVLFTDSRVYMAHYEYVNRFYIVYQNEKGVILRRPAEGW